jgi:hypothetical protein
VSLTVYKLGCLLPSTGSGQAPGQPGFSYFLNKSTPSFVSNAYYLCKNNNPGLFVIRATGSSASIINPPGFKPKAF